MQVEMIGIVFWGRSGSYLLSNLLNGHSQIASFPLSDFGNAYLRFAKNLAEIPVHCADSLANSLADAFPFLFTHWLAIDENRRGVPAIGEDKTKIPGISRTAFLLTIRPKLEERIRAHGSIARADLIVLMAKSYAEMKGFNTAFKYLLLDIHDSHPDILALLDKDFPGFKLITTVRYPPKTFDSHLWHHIHENPYRWPSYLPFAQISKLLTGMSAPSSWNQGRAIAVRFEDLHKNTAKIMRALAVWIGIPWEEQLLTTTMDQEICWFHSKGIYKTGCSPAAADDVSTQLLSKLDRLKIRCLFDQAYLRWDYAKEKLSPFEKALAIAAGFLPLKAQFLILFYRIKTIAKTRNILSLRGGYEILFELGLFALAWANLAKAFIIKPMRKENLAPLELLKP